MVEAGIGQLLVERFGSARVRKLGRQLTGSALTLNPDPILGSPDAIGDVKYMLSGGDWVRSDLYQVVAFAAASA